MATQTQKLAAQEAAARKAGIEAQSRRAPGNMPSQLTAAHKAAAAQKAAAQEAAARKAAAQKLMPDKAVARPVTGVKPVTGGMSPAPRGVSGVKTAPTAVPKDKLPSGGGTILGTPAPRGSVQPTTGVRPAVSGPSGPITQPRVPFKDMPSDPRRAPAGGMPQTVGGVRGVNAPTAVPRDNLPSSGGTILGAPGRFAKGGATSRASARADGIAKRGKTRGKMF